MGRMIEIRFPIGLLLFAVGLLAAESPAVLKFQDLFRRLNEAQLTKKKVQFQFSEAEVNEYLRYAQRTNPRPGFEGMTVKFFPSNYISTYTLIDFDMVEKVRPGTVPVLLRPVLNGQKAVWVDIRLRASEGAASFSVEKAYFNDIRIPAFVVEKMINVVGSRQKEKWDTSKPVPLPFALRSVSTGAQTVSGEN